MGDMAAVDCGKYLWRWLLLFLSMVDASMANAIIATPSTRPQRCTYEKAYGMNGVHCANLNLHSVPATLKGNIEILDLSSNRIRDLRNTTFIPYSKIRFLYLSDNLILTIDSKTFEPTYGLEVLDLSMNGLRTIPSFIFNLPALRKLYVANNPLIHLIGDLQSFEKPIKAPLEYLSLAHCELDTFPDFGIMPDLVKYNVSGNTLKDVGISHFTKLCKLAQIDMSDTYYTDGKLCDNKPLASWITERKINTTPETYSIFDPNSEAYKKCPDYELSEEDEESYKECTEKIKIKEKEKITKKVWIIIAGCIVGIIVLTVLFLICMQKRGKTKIKRRLENEIARQKESFLKNDIKPVITNSDM